MCFRSLAAVLGILAVVSCAHSPVRTGAFPAGPGLLEGRPEQATGTYRVVGWVLADQSGEPLRDALVRIEGMEITVRTDAHGRYLLPDVPWNRNEILVRAIGYQAERRTFTRKPRFGLWVCPVGDCKPTFTDTLNFWLHKDP